MAKVAAQGTLTPATDFPGIGVDAVVTLPAVTGNAYTIQHMAYSYSDTPLNGNMLITSGGTPIFDLDHTRSGEYVYNDKEDGIQTGINEVVVITLAHAGATPKLFVQYRQQINS